MGNWTTGTRENRKDMLAKGRTGCVWSLISKADDLWQSFYVPRDLLTALSGPTGYTIRGEHQRPTQKGSPDALGVG